MQHICNRERHGEKTESRFILDNLEDRLNELTDLYAGKVQLIYLDPPFATGERFMFKQRVGEKGYTGVNASALTLPAYSDDLPSDVYYAFLQSVLECCHKLLCDQGSLYLHIDYRTSARMRLMLDTVFGESNFLNEIIWHYKSGGRAKAHYSRKHDTIYFYRKSKKFYFNIKAIGIPRGKEARNHMRRTVDEHGRVVFTIKSGGKIYTYDEDTPVYPCDVWDDISHLQQKDPERTGYDTQKPEALLRRILLASSREGDLVADLFSGSGTTAAVAQQLGRRFLAVDSSVHALHVLRKRILSQPSTLFAPLSLNIELCWNTRLLSPSCTPNLVCSRRKNQFEIKLIGYETHKVFAEALPNIIEIDYVDYWAVGTIENDCFSPLSCAFRSIKAGKLRLSLSVPNRDGLIVQIVDSYGNQGLWPIET